MTHPSVTFQVDPGSAPSPPPWLEEVAAFAHILTQLGIREAIEKHVQFARARFGTYETIDLVLVLLSYALSGERTIASLKSASRPVHPGVSHPLSSTASPLTFCALPFSGSSR